MFSEQVKQFLLLSFSSVRVVYLIQLLYVLPCLPSAVLLSLRILHGIFFISFNRNIGWVYPGQSVRSVFIMSQLLLFFQLVERFNGKLNHVWMAISVSEVGNASCDCTDQSTNREKQKLNCSYTVYSDTEGLTSTIRETAMAAMLRRKCTCLWKHVNPAPSVLNVLSRCKCTPSDIQTEQIVSHVKCAKCSGSSNTLMNLARLHHSSAARGPRRCFVTKENPITLSSQFSETAVHPSLNKFHQHRRFSSLPFLSRRATHAFHSGISLKDNGQLHHARFLSFFSSSGEGDGNKPSDEDGGEGSSGEDHAAAAAEDGTQQQEPPAVHPMMGALSTMNVPEIFPRVPVVAVSRNPVFPRFVKMLEVLLQQCEGVIVVLLVCKLRS